MSAPRLVLVTRRFWPLVGGAEFVMASLAARLVARAWPTTVLTARWQTDWPAAIEHHGARVIRLPQPQRRMWGTWRYMRALTGWLRANRGEFDVVYVSMLKHDAYAALAVARQQGLPVALRAEGAGLSGDIHWQLENRFGQRIRRRTMKADAFVAPSPAIRDELIAAGYSRPRIHYVPNGVAIQPPRTDEAKRQAREALAELDPALALAPKQPLAVYTGRLHEAKGLLELVEAWGVLTQRHSEARLWLVGDGPLAEALLARINELDLADAVILAGSFDDVGELLSAADLFVLPSWEEGMSISLLEAMAAGLPIVATDIPGNRLLVEQDQHGLLVPTGEPMALCAAIERLLTQPALADRLGNCARERVARDYSVDAMVDAHCALFERLIAESRS